MVAVAVDRDEAAVGVADDVGVGDRPNLWAHLSGDVAHGTVSGVDPGLLPALARRRGPPASCRWSGTPARRARSAPGGAPRPASSRCGVFSSRTNQSCQASEVTDRRCPSTFGSKTSHPPRKIEHGVGRRLGPRGPAVVDGGTQRRQAAGEVAEVVLTGRGTAAQHGAVAQDDVVQQGRVGEGEAGRVADHRHGERVVRPVPVGQRDRGRLGGSLGRLSTQGPLDLAVRGDDALRPP